MVTFTNWQRLLEEKKTYRRRLFLIVFYLVFIVEKNSHKSLRNTISFLQQTKLKRSRFPLQKFLKTIGAHNWRQIKLKRNQIDRNRKKFMIASHRFRSNYFWNTKKNLFLFKFDAGVIFLITLFEI